MNAMLVDAPLVLGRRDRDSGLGEDAQESDAGGPESVRIREIFRCS